MVQKLLTEARKLPVFLDEEFQVGDLWITKKQLRKAVLGLFPNIVERSCISSKFDTATGEVVKKYAWHSVLSDINRQMLGGVVIDHLCDLDELNDR